MEEAAGGVYLAVVVEVKTPVVAARAALALVRVAEKAREQGARVDE